MQDELITKRLTSPSDVGDFPICYRKTIVGFYLLIVRRYRLTGIRLEILLSSDGDVRRFEAYRLPVLPALDIYSTIVRRGRQTICSFATSRLPGIRSVILLSSDVDVRRFEAYRLPLTGIRYRFQYRQTRASDDL